MRSVFTILLLCCTLTGFSNSRVFNKLADVNKCWHEQQDVQPAALAAPMSHGEYDWIRQHLMLVEQTLRNRSTAHLTAAQQAKREQALDHLNSYWRQGNFPVNDAYAFRTPIFIDKYDNFCAVGYLVKATGYEQVSRKIAAHTNLAYVKEMNYPELNSWASEYGFSVDELAWIQPGYPPAERADAVGGGTDGEVIELYPDDAEDILYVGGSFSTVDGNLSASNIAYVMDHNGVYMWHTMGDGVNGPVRAIVKHDNKVWVAGAFTEAGGMTANNVAYWDGSNWHAAGCTFGQINDLVVYNNELYAVGDFDVCAALSEVNFAKWDGTTWQQIPGLDGHVNTAEVVGNDLVLGGDFSYMSMGNQNVIKWNPTSNFQTYAVGINNEVMDLQVFKDTLFAACKQLAVADSILLQKLDNGAWTGVDLFPTNKFWAQGPTVSLNTLVVQNDTLSVGGEFSFATQLTPGVILHNASDIYPYVGGSAIAVDSGVNKMAIFKGRQFTGGKFKYNYSWGTSTNALNGIAVKKLGTNSIGGSPERLTLKLYPNPAAQSSSIQIEGTHTNAVFSLRDITGRLVHTTELGNQTDKIDLPALAPGSYMAELTDKNGQVSSTKLLIK